ncbi:MAG: PQQ-binding-like beta-propeller repeat protein, partial [Planctomycetota bacterium]
MKTAEASAVATVCLSTVLLLGPIGCGSRPPAREQPAATQRGSSSAGSPTVEESNVAWPSLLGESQNASIASVGYDLRRIDGEPSLQWVVPLGTGYGAAVVEGGKVVVMGRDDDQEFVRCLSLSDGTVQWNHTYPTGFECRFDYSSGPYSTPVLAGDDVFAWSAEGTIRCLRLLDGRERWSRDLRDAYDIELGDFPLASSPVIDSHSVFINAGGKKGQSGVIALDRVDGQIRWTATTDAASHATPVIRRIDRQQVL